MNIYEFVLWFKIRDLKASILQAKWIISKDKIKMLNQRLFEEHGVWRQRFQICTMLKSYT